MHAPLNDIKTAPPRNKNDEGKLAIITGATSGIGKAFADYYASQGYHLLLTGRRKDVMLDVALRLEVKYAVSIEMVFANLSRNEDLSRLLQTIGKRSNIEVLVNCAGYGLDERFSEDHINHQIAMLGVHVNAPLKLTHKVLPVMMRNHSGTIINVSSLAAYMPTAGNAMYTSTKSFLKNFTESLHMDVGSYGIKVQCLCPGFTHSDFHNNLNVSTGALKSGIIRWMEPSEVVRYSIACLNKGQVICIPGFLNKILAVSAMAVPRNLYYVIASRMEPRIKKRTALADAHAMPTLSPQNM
ncbi:MAG: SDR family oxidoreductase [Bacteroidales bacterium]